MRRPTPLTKDQCEALKYMLLNAETKEDFQRIQCLWLRYALRLTPEATAKAVGWSTAKVKNLQTRYLHEGERALVKQCTWLIRALNEDLVLQEEGNIS